MPTTIWDGDLTKTADTLPESAWSMRLGLCNFDHAYEAQWYIPATVRAEFCGAIIEMTCLGWYYDPEDPDILAAIEYWRETYDVGIPYAAIVYRAKVQTGSETQSRYLVCGYDQSFPVPPFPFKGPTEWILSGGFAISNLVMRGRCGAYQRTKRLNIRNWSDRFAQYILTATEDTVITAYLGDASVEFTYEFEPGEWPEGGDPIEGTAIVGGEAGQCTWRLSCGNLAQLNTDYCYADQIQWGSHEADMGDRVSFWSDDGEEWMATKTQPTGAHLHIFGADGKITLQRKGTGTSEAAGGVTCQALGPIKYNLHAAMFAPDSEVPVPATEEDWSAYVGLSQYVSETERQPVYLGVGESDWYMQTWWHYPLQVDNRIKTGEYYFDFLFAGCRVKQSWLEAHHELLENAGGEDEAYGYDSDQDNNYGYVVLPSVESTLSAADPHWDGPVSISWATTSVDIPPGKTSRPSLWVGDGVTVNNTTNSWVVGTGGGTVTRDLLTRYFARLDYINAGVPPGGWFDPDAPIWLKANYRSDDDDLPAWVAAVPIEDVTNYDNASWLALAFTLWPETAVGETVTMRLWYRLVTVEDPCYTCAEHRYMQETGEWTYSYSEHYFDFTGILSANGTVLFDLGWLPRDNYVNLQHVTRVRFTFPSSMAGEYTLDDVLLVPDAAVSGDTVLAFQPAIAPWEFLEDFCGAGATASGMTCLNLHYGYEHKRRSEYGMTQTQYRQHCPESELQDDISYAKALSRLVNELNMQECITAEYDTAAVAAAMRDDEGNRIGDGPYWWDLERGTGDALTGRAGIRVRNLVAVPYGTGPVPVIVHAYWTCGGRVHGLAYRGDERLRDDEGLMTSRRLKDGGAWEEVGKAPTNEYGRLITPPVGELYYAQVGNATYEVTTREYTPAFFEEDAFGLWDPHAIVDQAGVEWRAAENEGAVFVHSSGHVNQPWVRRAKVWPSGMARPSIAICDDGTLLVAATEESSGSMVIKRSRDRGQTWEAV